MRETRLVVKRIDGIEHVVPVPVAYMSRNDATRLSPHGGAYMRGYVAGRAGKVCKPPYDSWSMQGRGYERVWREGYNDGKAAK
jgi:hypothetical protein